VLWSQRGAARKPSLGGVGEPVAARGFRDRRIRQSFRNRAAEQAALTGAKGYSDKSVVSQAASSSQPIEYRPTEGGGKELVTTSAASSASSEGGKKPVEYQPTEGGGKQLVTSSGPGGSASAKPTEYSLRAGGGVPITTPATPASTQSAPRPDDPFPTAAAKPSTAAPIRPAKPPAPGSVPQSVEYSPREGGLKVPSQQAAPAAPPQTQMGPASAAGSYSASSVDKVPPRKQDRLDFVKPQPDSSGVSSPQTPASQKLAESNMKMSLSDRPLVEECSSAKLIESSQLSRGTDRGKSSDEGSGSRDQGSGSSDQGKDGGGKVDSRPTAEGDGLLEVRQIPGKGCGCVAVRNIKIGERLLAEAPLFELTGSWQDIAGPTHLYSRPNAAVSMLSPSERKRFFDLSQNPVKFGDKKTVAGVFATNAIPYERNGQSCAAIFPRTARLNHSCDPNAVYRWNSNLGCLTVHVCQPIAAGTEITVSYGPTSPHMDVTWKARQERLQASFGFRCACTKCTLTGSAFEASEQRLRIIGSVPDVIDLLEPLKSLADLLSASPDSVLAQFEERLALLCAECPLGHYPGVECMLLTCVQFCDSAAERLRQELTEVLVYSQQSPQPGSAASREMRSLFDPVSSSVRELDGSLLTVHCSPDEVHAQVTAYTRAAQRFAAMARDVTHDLEGADSPAYAAWCEALPRWNC